MPVTHRLQVAGRDCLGACRSSMARCPEFQPRSHLYRRVSDLQALLVPRIKSIQLVCGGKVQMLLANGGQRGRINCVVENVGFIQGFDDHRPAILLSESVHCPVPPAGSTMCRFLPSLVLKTTEPLPSTVIDPEWMLARLHSEVAADSSEDEEAWNRPPSVLKITPLLPTTLSESSCTFAVPVTATAAVAFRRDTGPCSGRRRQRRCGPPLLFASLRSRR